MVRREGGQATGDTRADQAYDYSGYTYLFYKEIFNRNSIDNNGMRLDSIVHYGRNFANAFWSGNRMVFGDGLPNIFMSFTQMDVVAHELTHGITQYEVGFDNYGEPAALNEHFCDILGSLVKQYVLKHNVDAADWLIGLGIFSPNVNGKALRSMKEPGTAYDDPVLGKDPQPGHMDNYMLISSDNDGAHINSGIPNRAFYLAAKKIGGNAYDKVGKIWYVTLRDRLQPNSGFQDAADFSFEVAGSMFGSGSREQEALRYGWESVGLSPKEMRYSLK